MPITANLNANYLNSNLVNQKYQPLQNITFVGEDDCIGPLVTQRKEVMNHLNISTSPLIFIGAELTTVCDTEGQEGMLPPLAVISSNRSGWIRETYDNGIGILNGKTNFIDVNDKAALVAGPVPFYCPYRLSAAETGHRNVYIFVFASEYNIYAKALAGTNMKVVGWKFGTNKNKENPECVGFGASRYAAIEFFRNIYRINSEKEDMPVKTGQVWLIDDNTVYINNFPGFANVESVMTEKGYIGIGFKGGTTGEPASYFSGDGFQKAAFNAATRINLEYTPILQQAVLWNIAALTTNDMNFSPLFFSSGEDGSFTRYINQCLNPKGEIASPCQLYSPCKVLKAETTYDNKEGYELLAQFKLKLYDLFSSNGDTPVNDATLLELLNTALVKKEPMSITISKSAEQILLSAMEDRALFHTVAKCFAAYADGVTLRDV